MCRHCCSVDLVYLCVHAAVYLCVHAASIISDVLGLTFCFVVLNACLFFQCIHHEPQVQVSNFLSRPSDTTAPSSCSWSRSRSTCTYMYSRWRTINNKSVFTGMSVTLYLAGCFPRQGWRPRQEVQCAASATKSPHRCLSSDLDIPRRDRQR